MAPLTQQIVELASRLIERQSLTPDDAGCQGILKQHLVEQGFAVQDLPFGPVKNFWASHGSGAPTLVFAGHTDVVPTGPAEQWSSPPFTPTIVGGNLHGRGSADMKGSLAAMILASQRFLRERPDHPGTRAYLVTSDEEGEAIDGTVQVVGHLEQLGIHPEFCVVGEPSSKNQVGDNVRVGRRGSLNGRLTVKGEQGHVAYPDQAANPIHAFGPALTALTSTQWDMGNDNFPPTSLQISNINGGTGAANVIPGRLEVLFNLRFSTEQTSAGLKQSVAAILDEHQLEYDLDWSVSGEPFLTARESLISAVSDSIEQVQSFKPELSTGGGTSDGRFIARLGTQIVELGPVNATIHSVDEHTAIKDLAKLSDIYLAIITRILPTPHA